MQIVRSLGQGCCLFRSVQSKHMPRLACDWDSSMQRFGNTNLEASVWTSDVKAFLCL